jgi:K+-sensing histidine kinase KdpD
MVLASPGSCDPVIGAAARSQGGTAVVTGDVGSLLAQVAVASRLQGGTRTFVIDPAGTLLSPGRAAVSVPAYLGPFSQRVSSGTGASARYTIGDARHTQVVGAGAPATAGWSVILEQDAASFDVAPVARPSRVAVVILGASFITVLLLQAASDARHRRATRRIDAHRAAFLAVLSHELRTPLTVIRGFVDTLSTHWASLGEAQRHELVDLLPQQSRRLNRVVERLLLAANLQAGSYQRPARRSVAVRPALERVVDEFAPLAPLHELLVDAEPGLSVRADRGALDQILDQLVDNAVKYSPSGGTVRVGAVRRRGRLEIFVEDEGMGLPGDTRGIFDAFVQGESVEARVHDEGGVGVGLYIVRTLSEHLGGSVRAERGTHGGARLVVTLGASRASVPTPV